MPRTSGPRCAGRAHYGVPFAARSGGHSYGGYSASRGLVISLARMNSVRVDAGSMTVTLGPGARNRDLYAGLAGTGVAVPSGRCPTVGVSGLLLGGGFGFSSRHLGLTCDRLLETEVVTASGTSCGSARRSTPTCSGRARAAAGATSDQHRLHAASDRGRRRVRLRDRVGVAQCRRRAGRHAGADGARPRTRLSCRVGLGVSGGGPATGGPAQRSASALGLYFGPARELAELLAPVLAAAPPSRR